jgi:hypothetical protein
MAEVLVEFSDILATDDGTRYAARACGAEADGGMWQGWIEFIPLDKGEVVRSSRETTQPNRQDTVYWATGLTPVYLEGALTRALNPLTRVAARPNPEPVFDGPAPSMASAPPAAESILNPFSVYRKGEDLLRRQLGALSAWHLVNIIRDYELSSQSPDVLQLLAPSVLVETIVNAVKARAENGRRSDSETVVS